MPALPAPSAAPPLAPLAPFAPLAPLAPLAPDPLDDLSLPSLAAGLAFLTRPLLDLGWPAALDAIHPDPSLALHALHRRLLARTLGDHLLGDPATWLLAGLLDAPTPDERHLDARAFPPHEIAALARAAGAPPAATFDDAIDAWATACLDETRLRLGPTETAADLARHVIAIPGTLRARADRLEVRVPFTAAYADLLRAGLSPDIDSVPWLDGRPLRFVFRGGAEEIVIA